MKLSNVEVKWVYHQNENKFGKHNITVILDDKQAAEMQAAGLSVKTDDEGVKFYNFTQSPVTRKGKKNPIPVFDRFGEEFDGIVPNGTRADIAYIAKPWSVSGNSGVKGYIRGVKLLDDVMGNELEFDEPHVEATDDSPF